jgi:hypothetical protein
MPHNGPVFILDLVEQARAVGAGDVADGVLGSSSSGLTNKIKGLRKITGPLKSP